MTTTHVADGATDWLAKRAALSPGKVALIEARTRTPISYDEWNRRANRVTHALQALGLHKGDRVAVLSTNNLEYLDLLFACQKGGFILQALNWRLSSLELLQLIEDAAPRVLIASSRFATTVDTMLDRARIQINHAISIGPPTRARYICWHDWIATMPDTPPPHRRARWTTPGHSATPAAQQACPKPRF